MPILSSFGGLSAIGRGQRAGGRKLIKLVISANTSNYVLNTAKVSGLGYEPGNTDVVLTINAGVVVGSASTGSFAFDVDTSWHALDGLLLINKSGVDGRGGSNSSGGPALRAQRPISIDNSLGRIAAGGGSGGRGGGALSWARYFDGIGWPCGCEPGGSCGYGAGGNGQGSQGNATGGGAGGCTDCNCCDGAGGAGGAYGSAGASGQNSSGVICGGTVGPTAGYAAGACTSGNSNITWIAAGIRYGALN